MFYNFHHFGGYGTFTHMTDQELSTEAHFYKRFVICRYICNAKTVKVSFQYSHENQLQFKSESTI